jgi:hypothetical protein
MGSAGTWLKTLITETVARFEDDCLRCHRMQSEYSVDVICGYRAGKSRKAFFGRPRRHIDLVRLNNEGKVTHRYDDLLGAHIFNLIAAVYEACANVVTSISPYRRPFASARE